MSNVIKDNKCLEEEVTYKLSKSGSTIKLTGSDGSTSSVTDSNTTYGTASTTSNGLMSSTDKSKLDGIDENANNYSLPTAGSTLGGVKTTSTVSSNSGYTACPIISGVPYYKDTNTTTSIVKLNTTVEATSGDITLDTEITDFDIIIVATGYTGNSTYRTHVLFPYNAGDWTNQTFSINPSETTTIALKITDSKTVTIQSRTGGYVRHFYGIKLP